MTGMAVIMVSSGFFIVVEVNALSLTEKENQCNVDRLHFYHITSKSSQQQ